MVNNIGKHGKQHRKGVTLQLVEGQDDDLIEAISNLGGSRQAALKKWLRESQGFAQALDESASLDHDQAIDYLVKAAGYLISRVEATESHVSGLRPYLESLIAQLPGRPELPSVPNLTPQPGVSQETLDKRNERLKKRGW